MKPIALQLYTLRKDVYPGGDDLPGVLRTVAEIGYKGVELFGLQSHQARDAAKALNDLGLQVTSSHVPFPAPENYREIAEMELTLGNKRAVAGFGPDHVKTVDGCKQAAAMAVQAVELMKSYGMTFGIHNHWWDFEPVDGIYPYDILMAEAPGMFSELDIYWVASAKVDPVKLLSKYKSRIPLLHVKDGMLEQRHPHVAVGSGKLDIPAIIGATDPNVVDWLIVELDMYDGDMLDAVRQSYKYLTSTGLASGKK